MRGIRARAIRTVALRLAGKVDLEGGTKSFVEATLRKFPFFNSKKKKKQFKIWGQQVNVGYKAIYRQLKRAYTRGIIAA